MGSSEGHSLINVLYVDDEPSLLDIGKIFLEKNGNFKVYTLTSAKEALDSIKDVHYDAIVADYQMPEMDGIDLLKKLKSSGNNTPFIIFTGKGREEVVIEALNNGADFYIQKRGETKSQFAELSNKIHNAVTRRSAVETLENVVKKNEAALRKEDYFWKLSGNATKHPLFILDSDQRILQCNSVVWEIFGIKADEAVGKHCWEIVHGTSEPIPGCPFVRMQETLSREIMELYFNDRIHVVTVDPMLDENGTLVGAVHNIRDITDYRLTEVALRESEEKFREFFNNATDAIVIHDTDGRILEVNDTICNRLGYSREEMILMTPFEIDAPEYASRVSELIDRVQKNDLIAFETIHRTKDGKYIPVEVRSRPIGYQGKTAILSTARDISERKKAEDALRQANRKLKILSGITRHDIKNSIMATYGFLDLIRDAEPEERKEYLEKVNGIIQKINRQIEFTRLYENLGTKDPKWQDIKKIIRKLEIPKTVSIRIDGAEEEIFADMMLWKVFENLLDDSVRHGQHVTEIWISSQRSDGDLIVVWEDNGIGIPFEEKKKIFEQGFGKNTGLGLFLSREILSITGISIKETGEPGKGARFEITVPESIYRTAP